MQGEEGRGAVDFRHGNFLGAVAIAAPFQLGALRQQFCPGEKLFLQRAGLLRQVGNETVQILRGIAEPGRELIERRERRGDLVRGDIPFFHRADFAQPNVAQLSRQRFVLRRDPANDVDVFEPGLPKESQVREVLAEEPEAFAEKENRDQGEHDDGDEGVAAEEGLDALFDRHLGATRFGSRGNEDARSGDAFHGAPSFAEASALRQRV